MRVEARNIMKDILFYMLKIIVIVVLVAVAFIVGAMIGYTVIGDGGNPLDIFNPQLWRHVLDFFV